MSLRRRATSPRLQMALMLGLVARSARRAARVSLSSFASIATRARSLRMLGTASVFVPGAFVPGDVLLEGGALFAVGAFGVLGAGGAGGALNAVLGAAAAM